MKKNILNEVSCHFNWKHDAAKFKERAKRNIQTCLEHIRDNPDPTVYNFLGYLYFTENNLEQALLYFKECLKKYPESPITLANLAYLYQSQGLEGKASKYIRKLDTCNPAIRLGWTHWSKAYFHIRLYEYDEAIAEYNAAITCLPHEYKAYLYKGICLNRQNKFAEAIDTLKIAKTLLEKSGETNHIVFYHLGRAYGQLGPKYLQHAIEYFNLSFRIKPDDAVALKFFGKISINQHQYKKAMEHFNRSILSKPTSSAYHNRGILHKKFKKYTKAQADLEMAVQLQPSNFAALLSLIEVLILNKRGKEAINKCSNFPVDFAKATLLYFWAQALDLLDEKNAACNKYLNCFHCQEATEWQKRNIKLWLIIYYTNEFNNNKNLDRLVILVKFLYEQVEFQQLKDLIKEYIAQYSESFHLHYYAALIFLEEHNYELSIRHLTQAFELTEIVSQKFLCYEVYANNADNTNFCKYADHFLKLYSLFETTHQKTNKPLWHKTFNLVLRSKSPNKVITLGYQADRVHGQLRTDTLRMLSQPKVQDNVNYLHACLTLIVTDQMHKKNGDHRRIPIEIPLLIKEKDIQEPHKPQHVTSCYSFKVDSKSFPRSDVLLKDVLTSKPIAKHASIIKQYQNTNNANFHRDYHCSERALYGYLNKQDVLNFIIEVINQQCKNLKNIKCYALVIDIHSVRYLCMNCEESMFFWYNPKRVFVQTLMNKLTQHGFIMPTKTGTLRCVVRVSAEKPGHKQATVTACEHTDKQVDIKDLTTDYSILLLERDNFETEKNRSKHETFSNLKMK